MSIHGNTLQERRNKSASSMNGQGVTHIIHIQIDTIPISAGKKIMRYGHCINAGAYNENGKCLAATVDDARARRAVLLSTLATEEWEAQTDGTVAARWRHDCAEKGDNVTKIVEVGCCGNSKVSRRDRVTRLSTSLFGIYCSTAQRVTFRRFWLKVRANTNISKFWPSPAHLKRLDRHSLFFTHLNIISLP